MIKKTFLLTVLISMSTSIIPIFAQNIWDLEKCVNYAIDNNLSIKQSEYNVNINEATLKENKLAFAPSVNGNSSYSWGWGRTLDQTTYQYYDKRTSQGNFSVSADVSLFAGFQQVNTYKKSKVDLESSAYTADKMRDDISLAIVQAYLTILYNKEQLEVAREQIKITQQQIERTQKLVDAGSLAKGNLLDIQAQGANEELNVVTRENNLALSYLDLQQLLDLPPSKDFEIVIPSISVDENIQPQLVPAEHIFEYAVSDQPDVKSAALGVESSNFGLKIAQGRLYPSLSLGAGISTNYSDQFREFDPITLTYSEVLPFGEQLEKNQNKYLGFSLRIPIFNGLSARSGVKKAMIGTEMAQTQYQIVKNQLRKKVEQAYNDALASFKSYKATIKSVEALKEAFDYMDQKFTVGLANAVDYNLAKQQLTKAESDLLMSKYDFTFKTKILDFYLGKPITIK